MMGAACGDAYPFVAPDLTSTIKDQSVLLKELEGTNKTNICKNHFSVYPVNYINHKVHAH